MKPEQLKLIAEYMGYEIAENTTYLFVIYPDETTPREFDPLFNADQSMELLKMLLDNNYGSLEMLSYEGRTSITFAEKIVDGWQHKRKEHYIQGDSLEQAILNAALETAMGACE